LDIIKSRFKSTKLVETAKKESKEEKEDEDYVPPKTPEPEAIEDKSSQEEEVKSVSQKISIK